LDLLTPARFEDAVPAYGYVGTIFDQVAAGERPATVSITPSTRHVGVTRRDTFRPGFADAVRAANDEGYPVLVRSSGGGATAADAGTFGFAIIRPAGEEIGRGIPERYDEAAALVLGAFSRLGLAAEVGEVRDEFCPGDHSVRVGGWAGGMKLCGIAQRVTNRATSVGGIVLVEGEKELARVLEKVYGALQLPFRPGSVGSARTAGSGASVEAFLEAFAAEAEVRYGARRVPIDDETIALARKNGVAHLIHGDPRETGPPALPDRLPAPGLSTNQT